MMEGVSTVCFASSYAVALALEVYRLRYHRALLRMLTVAFAAAGIVAHTIYLAVRARAAAASPLSSPYDWYLLAAWLLALVYLALLLYYPRLSMGLFVLPLTLALIGAAHFADRQPFTPSRASRFWGDLHGTFLLLGTVAVTIGFASAVMYLAQSHRLKSKRLPAGGLRLPSLEWLERVNRRTLAISALLIGVGFLGGVVLNQIRYRAGASRLLWYDPVVLSSAAMFGWLVIAELFRLLSPTVRGGRRTAYLNVTAFALLAIALVTLSLVKTRHGPSRSPTPVSAVDSPRGTADGGGVP